MQKSSSAPIRVKIQTVRKTEDATYRAVDVWFHRTGSWETFTSKEFGDGILKAKEKSKESSILSRAGFLTEAEAVKRGLNIGGKPGQQESRYFYTTFTLFDRAEVSATRFAVASKTPTSLLLAAYIDPRFANDAEFPNQWRTVERDATAELVYGRKQAYHGAGFYAKVTRLAKPDDAIFVEYHSVFNEPKGWFDGENLLRSKVPTIASHQVTQFRGKLAKATLAAAAAKE